MTTATRPDNLETLRLLLQEGLQSQLSPLVPIQVQCFLKEGALVILAQHPAPMMPEPQAIFGFFKQTVNTEHRSGSQEVQLYLRITGQKQPYAFQTFTVEPTLDSTATATPVDGQPDATGIADSQTPNVEDRNSVETKSAQKGDASTLKSESPHPWDQPVSGLDAKPHQSSDAAQPVVKAPSKPALLPLVVAGTALGLVVFASTLYFLTRPCVIGQCQAIPEAQKLSQKSAKTMKKPQSGRAVLEAQAELDLAIQMLESIPVWSSHHAQAQTLLKTYRGQADSVSEMVTALKTAARASYKSENPPHPPSKWIEIQGLWREAIAQLEQLPTESNLQPLAKQKIKAYKTNLAEANQRLVKEREAQGQITAAKEAALIAEARQGVAQSLPHWQLVYATWQTATKRLKQIPQGTTAYEEAQQLSALYLPKIATARDRKTQEQIATNAYNQGLRLAQLAKTSQATNQWSVAVIHWRNALAYMNQVPRGTFYYGKAQSLLGSYNSALKQAQEQLQNLVKIQQARSDLNETCSAKVPICSYTIDKNLIKIRLTPTYMQMVKQTVLAAKVRGDSNAQSNIVNHVLTLGDALEAISDNARLPVEVYAPDGTLIETHSPGI